ncbi:MAG: hypothetical protein IPI66_03815 [Chitinophagaceae bacterium]|nr:hypothetical protein [Chitinophagaceae bacterium]
MTKPLSIAYSLFILFILSGCEFNCSVGENKSVKAKPVTSNDNTPLNGAIIKNNIDIEATGVKLNSAYLRDAQRKPLTENLTAVGDKIYLYLETDTGWVKQNGKSYLGAAERLTTSNGKVIVDAPDIFRDYEESGLPARESEVITLSAVLTQADPAVDHYIVRFRVWDKKGSGEIKGSYTFKIK